MSDQLPIERKLFGRELRGNVGPYSVRGLYGSKIWVDNLDITNELFGHRGCVNALSWSRSGHLLASGSDDTHINIHTTKPNFAFNTSIQTGHTANIFSVKFMPFSDNKIVSCAGDWEVRVFDVEYAPTANTLNSSPRVTRLREPRIHFSRNTQSLPKPAKLYNEGECETKVYTSHTDRVKRIVTENSPWLFLTCSEDGEVRQFDLRQPSGYYSRGNGSSARAPFTRHHFTGMDILVGPMDESDDRNPPLISYKKHRIELNTISCSVGQPHYIALGGSHQHCFLHDRRMLGRDISTEQGQQSSLTESELSSATRCVKRFAPKRPSANNVTGLRRARDNGHITACKISDANPNEVIVSWSGDDIYLFDINHNSYEPEAPGVRMGTGAGRSRGERDRKGKGKGKSQGRDEEVERMEEGTVRRIGIGRKRKRSRDTAAGSAAGEAPPRQRSARSWSANVGQGAGEDMVMRYTTGETEEVDLDSFGLREGGAPTAVPGQSMMRIAGLVVDLRKELFGLENAKRALATQGGETLTQPMIKRSFTAALGLAKVCLERMDDIIEKHRAKNTSQERTSPSGFKRARARRFVQACGALSFALGGRLQTLSPMGCEVTERRFGQVEGIPGPECIRSEGIPIQSDRLGWRYSFIQLLAAYARSGLTGIYKLANEHGYHSGNPGEDSKADCIAQKKLFDAIEAWWPHRLLTHGPMRDIDSPGELIFPDGGEGEAWKSFREEVETEEEASLDRRSGFWGFKVARALLLREGNIIDFSYVNSVFRSQDESPEEEDKTVASLAIRGRGTGNTEAMSVDEDEDNDEDEDSEDDNNINNDGNDDEEEEEEKKGKKRGEEEISVEDLPGILAAHPMESAMLEQSVSSNVQEGGEEEEEGENEKGDEDDEEDDDGEEKYGDGDGDEEEDDESENYEEDRPLRLNGRWRRRGREIESQAPVWSAIRTYSGHCNVKTVKDVNFYGLDDEYVVSGSDCGHLFIWDKKTSKLVQLLYGDSDTVNVVTGHPYEPQLAVSGIDHTVKIFSPDQASQTEFLNQERINRQRNDEESDYGVDSDHNEIPKGSRRRLHNEYQIRSQNDSMRYNGVQEELVTVSDALRILFPPRLAITWQRL
ncbi:WD40 repeat-like protein [Terfezia boudieri ATCC MYA-4762]|uniref:WD40 repeat-like protein n=1 Tax=Terfezia boudieri ATCC MYA-4762 TaxID=1051890 RepID=A0A3N4L936_9PEZI|nr:WD40 repeat-like protein [Terfezia boudieri ATCC MYA-4762]